MGGEGSTLISRIDTMLQPQDMADGKVEYTDPGITAVLTLQTQLHESATELTLFDSPKEIILPPPGNLHIAFTRLDCQFVASELGNLHTTLKNLCVNSLVWHNNSFLVWDWPEARSATQGVTEDDLIGFEMKLELIDAEGGLLGENIASIPYPEARGALRNFPRVECGLGHMMFIRAVGRGLASDWVLAGLNPPQPCKLSLEEEVITDTEGRKPPQINGCGGQIDLLPSWLPLDDFPPDLWFTEVCNIHDYCYEPAWSGKDKVYCDNKFYRDMLEVCSNQGALEQVCNTAAWAFYEAVNQYGRFFFMGKINPWDCVKAYDPAVCALYTTPEILMKTGQLIESSAEYAYEVGETMVDKSAGGVEWIVDQAETSGSNLIELGGKGIDRIIGLIN
jgi:hypothetical protein